MIITSDYHSKNKKTTPVLSHHFMKRREKFSEEYFAQTSKLFGGSKTFGKRKPVPGSKKTLN
jgi:hypothetical protein